MEGAETRVDGNAIAGALGEVFVHEMTAVRIACDGCGQVEPIGAEHAYVQGPGMVLRCAHCHGVLLVLTRAEGRSMLGLRGARWFEFADEP